MLASPAPRSVAFARGAIRHGLTVIAATLAIGAGQASAQDVTIAHGYSNFGELKYPADFEHLDYVNPDAPKGGEISIWWRGNFDSFNSYAREGVAAYLNTIGGEGMLASTLDDPYGMYCFICTTIEYPEDLSFITYNLREDVTFANGTPMTAEDVEFTFNLFLEQALPEYRAARQGFVDRVEVESPYRITFYFTDRAPKNERMSFSGGLPIFSKAWFKETGARLDESTQEPFMATGPYVLDSFDFNRRIVYTRNPDYWGEDIPFNRGRNNFDSIRVEYFADSDAAFEGFKAGNYTFRTETSSQDWATGYDFRAVDNGWVVREEIPDGAVGTRLAWVFNLDKPEWQDQRVRQAIKMMLNFEWSNQTLFSGLFNRPVSFWPNTDLAASGPPSNAEVELLRPLVEDGLLDASILTDDAYVPAENSAASNMPARRVLRQASALLDEAGWEIGDDGVRRNADGQVLDLLILQFNPQFDRVINPYIENLKVLGVRARLERVDTSQYVERRRKGDFDMTSQAFAMRFEPSLGLEQWFASKTADDSSRNLMRLRNPAVDRLIPFAVQAETLDEVTTSIHALDRVLRSIEFDIPLWYNPNTWVAYYDFYRRPDNLPPLLLTGELDFWWYDAEAADALRAAGAF